MDEHSQIEMSEQKKTHKWRWCLVGNIIGEHRHGENGESKFGTKSFSTGTKVYIAPLQWGDGGERVIVIGKARHGYRYVEIIIASKYIKNFRLKKVFDPKILKKMDASDFLWWDDTDETKETITALSSSLNARSKTWEDVDDVLFSGSEEEIKNIRCPECGGIISFKYSYDGRRYGAMRVICGSCHIMAVYCKIIHRPNCVTFFGNEATLIDNTFINIGKIKETYGSCNDIFPSIYDLISDEAPEWKEEVLQYLRMGTMFSVAPGLARDVISGEKIDLTLCMYNDGEYAWRSDIIYYVEKYNMRLEEDFVNKVLKCRSGTESGDK